MKNAWIAWTTQFVVAVTGVIIFSQAVSFGRPKEGKNLDFVVQVHACILIAAGIGLLAASIYIFWSHKRMTALETSLSKLKEKS